MDHHPENVQENNSSQLERICSFFSHASLSSYCSSLVSFLLSFFHKYILSNERADENFTRVSAPRTPQIEEVTEEEAEVIQANCENANATASAASSSSNQTGEHTISLPVTFGPSAGGSSSNNRDPEIRNASDVIRDFRDQKSRKEQEEEDISAQERGETVVRFKINSKTGIGQLKEMHKHVSNRIKARKDELKKEEKSNKLITIFPK